MVIILRVDDRLLHGQVAFSWLNFLVPDAIVIANDEVFTNEIQKAIGRCIIMTDAAHAFGATWHNKPVGSIADFSNFSFHAVKNFTTAEGGAVTWKDIEGIDNEVIYKKYQLLSNGIKVKNGDMVCIEVSPVTWLIDNRDKKLIAKRGLLSGIKFNNKKYDGDFDNTKMNEYLNKYMLKDLTQSVNLSYSRDDDENRRKVKNIESTTILNNNPKVRTR